MDFVKGGIVNKEKQKELLLSKADSISPEDRVILVGAPFEMPPIPSDNPLVKELFQAMLGIKSEKIKIAFSHLFKTLTGPEKQVFLNKEREALRGLFKALYPKLQTLQSKEEQFWGEALLGQFLSYYTFFGPENGESIAIPVFEDKWHLVDYTVEKIPLTPSWMGSQAVAFGLKPKDKAPPLLLFKGTSYPTDEGFSLQLLSDCNPLASVGSYLFWFGKENIGNWLKNNPRARVFGLSLGGSLTELAVLHFPSLIESAFAYNCPALFPWEVKNSPEHAGVHIFCNEKDLSSVSGFSYGKGWNVYKVLVKKPSSSLPAHVQCYLARNESILLKIKPKKTFSQMIVASLHTVISIPLFIVGSLAYALSLPFRKKT